MVVLVVLVVLGDLARTKVVPAVYDLHLRGLLPPSFSRRDWDRRHLARVVHDAVREHARTPFQEEVWAQLSDGIRFVSGDIDDPAAEQLRRAGLSEAPPGSWRRIVVEKPFGRDLSSARELNAVLEASSPPSSICGATGAWTTIATLLLADVPAAPWYGG